MLIKNITTTDIFKHIERGRTIQTIEQDYDSRTLVFDGKLMNLTSAFEKIENFDKEQYNQICFNNIKDSLFISKVLEKCAESVKKEFILKMNFIKVESDHFLSISKSLSNLNITLFSLRDSNLILNESESIFDSFINSKSLSEISFRRSEINMKDIKSISMILQNGITPLTSLDLFDDDINQKMILELVTNLDNNLILKKLCITYSKHNIHDNNILYMPKILSQNTGLTEFIVLYHDECTPILVGAKDLDKYVIIYEMKFRNKRTELYIRDYSMDIYKLTEILNVIAGKKDSKISKISLELPINIRAYKLNNFKYNNINELKMFFSAIKRARKNGLVIPPNYWLNDNSKSEIDNLQQKNKIDLSI